MLNAGSRRAASARRQAPASRQWRPRLFPLLFLVALTSGLGADGSRVAYRTEIDADIDAVWAAFTTADGLKSWMAPVVDIDLKVGGKMRANYRKEGSLDDETAIENTILAFDPKSMLSLKATRFPKGFPFLEAARKAWSVFYFDPLPDGRTRVTVAGLGYDDTPESRKMKSFFQAANQQSFDKLKQALSAKRQP